MYRTRGWGCLLAVFSSVGVALVFIVSCQTNPREPHQNAQAVTSGNRVQSGPTGANVSATEAEDGRWIMPAKNFASTRFSGSDQINASNVSSLKLAWSFSTGVMRGHQAAPIVADNTMFIVTPYPNILYALDLT